MSLYLYPPHSLVDRHISKNTLYAKGQAATHIEKLFIEQVEKITWAYKLAPTILHLQEDGADISEVQIFVIHARTARVDERILRYIDEIVPSRIIFEIHYANTITVSACYKRRNLADGSKSVLSRYFYREYNADSPRMPLPTVLSMQALYHDLIKNVLPVVSDSQLSIDECITQADNYTKLVAESQKLTAKLHKEKQANRKVDINIKLQQLKRQLQNFTPRSV